MKNTVLFIPLCVFCFTATAQTPSLQDVTVAGSTTNRWLQLTGSGGLLTTGAGLELYGNSSTATGYVKVYNRSAGTPGTLKLQDSGGNILMNENGGNVGIGTVTPAASLHVNSAKGVVSAKFTQSDIPANEGYLHLQNQTGTNGNYIPGIIGRARISGRTLGLYITGEADDIIPPASDLGYAAVVLDGRSKTGTRLSQSNVLAVCSYGENLMIVKADGSVGIGATDTKGYKLAVAGSMIAEKVKVKLQSGWPDYVFEEDYPLPPLGELARYVQEHKHLPDVPSEKEVTENGLDLGEMNKKLLQKVEELTLYLIQQQKLNEAQSERIAALEEAIKNIKKYVG